MIQTFAALANQNIYDVCLMTYGTLDNLFKLIQDNNFGSVDNYPYMGQVFTWDDSLVFNEAVNISNSLNNVNYSTASNSTGNITYNVITNGLPINGQPIVSPQPPLPNTGTGEYDYYIIFNTDPRWNSGTNTFTDPYLKGKSGYAIYAQQNSQFFSVTEGVDVHYDSIAGTFTVIAAGFYIVDLYYLIVYPNKYDTTIP